MRILNICAYTWAIGGPARIIYDHTSEVLRQGHQVDILSPMTPGEKLYPTPEGARLIPCRRTTPLSTIYREFSVDLYRYLKKHIHEYDLIHVHGIWHFGSLAPFLIPNQVPKVITIHGLLDRWAVEHSKWKKQLVTLLYQKKLLGKADLIQINNTDEEQDVIRYLGYRPPNMAIIPNGMKIADYSSLPEKGIFRKHFAIPSDRKMVLFMGRLNTKKGLDLLLPAFMKYLHQHNDALLVLAGPDDGYLAQAEEFIQLNALQDSIRLVGMLTDSVKKAALADADLFVLPSYSEGFSIAVLEAMTAQVPALVSDRVGFGDYIQAHQAAYLTPLTVEGVAEGLEKTLQDATYRENIRQNAYQMVLQEFDIQVVANRLLEEYKKIQR
ncbi:glycosyltransferase [Rhabdobacter roseus]|uniref:Glycosyltransferase involved in cell wall biosynthesis n=1 Tax=Rhabdobacter roseus TaxID=1655419 RepID=A0A840TUY8_9BACT|nr:glycosyltransferase [Rhabdobacter roseus]MBB5283489.1 glycosyltransferase involved in cell wall biosynthesis [Rhabdobacter roseus]